MAEARPIDVTDDKFKSVVLGNKNPLVVEFWSPQCIHCQRMANTVDALAKELGGMVKVYKVNVLENMESPQAFKVSNIPAFFYLKDGKVAGSTVGAMSKGKLKEALGID